MLPVAFPMLVQRRSVGLTRIARLAGRLGVGICLTLSLMAQTPHRGIWISRDEALRLPMSGIGWENLKNHADRDPGVPNLSDQDQKNNVYVLAKALVYARTGEEHYRQEVIQQCMAAIGTERGGRTLALGRELAAYVIAADLVGLPAAEDARFRDWLRETLSEVLQGRTLPSTHADRPNNWGTHAGASRMAVAVYLGDSAELARAAQVFKGWLGDRSAWAGFKFQSISAEWEAEPSAPVPVNPAGATKEGHSIDGVITDDQSRSGGFTWPPAKENYAWEAMQGAIVQAVILSRHGYPDVFKWQNRAILRIYQWLYEQAHFPAEGNHTWQLPLIDYYYGTAYWDGSKTYYGKNMGWTSWTHAERGAGDNGNSTVIEEKPAAAAVTSFSPTQGAVGTTITVRGSGFGTTRSVQLGSAQVSFQVASDTSLTFAIPAAAVDGRITVTNSTGPGSSSSTLTVLETPVVNSFSPSQGSPGASVTITGSHFRQTTNVAFGGSTATYTVNSETRITATLPSAAQTGPITVANAAGSGMSQSNFSVLKPPKITSFTPSQGAPGTAVTIRGENLEGLTKVNFNGINTEFSVKRSGIISEIVASVPRGSASGPISISNSTGSAVTDQSFKVLLKPSPPDRFSIGPDLGSPLVESVAPTSGRIGTRVTLSGQNLAGVSSVRFNGVPAPLVVSPTKTQIVVTVPVGATSGPISVTGGSTAAVWIGPFSVSAAAMLQTYRFVADEDARLSGSQPSKGFGSAGDLRVKAGDSGLKSLLKFSVKAVSGRVTHARLRLYCTNPSDSGGSVALTASDWSEASVTWDNAPAVTSEPTPASGPVAESAWAELDVTSLVAGNGTYSFLIESASSDTAIYDARERANQPELVIETEQ